MSWTDERIQQLKDLWSQGLSASEIADILGDITRNAVIGKAHRLGLSGRPSPIKKKPTRGATILALTERMCKWPVGDPKHQDFHFCGKNALPGMPYCAEHAALAYQPASGSKKREEDRNVGAA
ncbi:global cell cycle regulator GcrA-like protein [Azospirillum oryzae]|uniref:Global cell cycle regulator GcrA-like protein n=1 Tax=Azospirillum oryzae TaxID=286727 RepID=A0A6N1ALI0_9PROT|nr:MULTISPECIES: GcrA family cell cycle regulator [Azospirillum]KAA0575238.1 global cell cycle regulator GcrA-like protein [Azospirillum sp. Sh1]KAA0591102.1 global cell cycle regulator GcrA-like protein [Azospirillum oryzae]QKS52390.1 global cell cycle regulator GcrA-like protein [Azospirillum oryzae]GLR78041.1 global cell cycle regulator GcrA-like protein [Azospirillum oryzae]